VVFFFNYFFFLLWCGAFVVSGRPVVPCRPLGGGGGAFLR